MKTKTKVGKLKPDRRKGVVAMKRLERAQRLVRKYVKSGKSLVDELIAERHAK